MRALVAISLLIAMPAALGFNTLLAPWTEGTVIGINSNNSKSPAVIYTTTVYAVGTCPGFDGMPSAFEPCNPPSDTWTDVDMTQFGVPSTAKAVFLSGEMIITPGNTTSTAEVAFECRAPGSTLPAGAWDGYTTVPRSVEALWCPVVGGKIEYQWHHEVETASGPVSTLSGFDFGINLSLQAYLR